jgi:hypothetical protein
MWKTLSDQNTNMWKTMWKTLILNLKCGKQCGKPSKLMKNVENFIRPKYYYVENYVENSTFESRLWKTIFL